ncbi:OsmC family protein [Streptomyces sp. ACA25]|uniref:OsmC family protein n=1 Tax=Streptomyces sp. ACA25 TaxID=3022596 RepID=UPI002307DF7A|nr:OsmC family protein [Streptomyces sp. ACA25]MDB1086088.1 OsmC family protein [Streptomyces sp. ACA25]
MTTTQQPVMLPDGMTEVAPAGRIEVSPVLGDTYRIQVRGHQMLVDQPVEDGGTDAGVTPVELFAASLASCVAFYAGRYLKRHGVSSEKLRVSADFSMAADRPARVAGIRVRIVPPADLPDERRAALLAVASHCTVHNSLVRPPDVEVTLD